MKLNKIITTALFSIVAAQTISASVLEVGSAPISLEPHFIHESFSFDKQSNELSLSVSSSNELEVAESVPCEDHSLLSISGVKFNETTGAISVDISGESTTIGFVKGKGKRVKLNDDIKISYNTSIDDDQKELNVSLTVLN